MKNRLVWMCQVVVFVLLFPRCALALPQEIIFWHAMSGQLGEAIGDLTRAFNERQDQYVVKSIYKGDYTELLTSFAAAFRAHQPPNIIQVFEVGTSAMLFPSGIIKPIESLMREQGMPLSIASGFPAVYQHYRQAGLLMAMPLNVSIPVLFYNADALASIGVGSRAFPKTWDGFERLLTRLKAAGFSCGYTTAYPTWILIESYQAIQGLTSASEKAPLVSHLKRMRRWQQAHYFEYGGRVDDATVLFTSGRCPVFSQSSGAYVGLSELVPFHLGVAPMPLDTEVSSNRHSNVVGGAAIWAVANQSHSSERGIAQFLTFIAEPSSQKVFYERTGYFPLTSQEHLPHQEILDIAALDLKNAGNHSTELMPIPSNQIRTIHDQMLEAIFSGLMGVDEAMDKASLRIDHAIDRFRKNNAIL